MCLWPVCLILRLSWFGAFSLPLYGSVPCLHCSCGVVYPCQLPSRLDDSRSCVCPGFSSCANNLWVEGRNVPMSCLSYPWFPLVLSLRLTAVWLSYLRTWRVAALTCALSTSSCASTLWVEGHSMPEACLSSLCFDLVLSLRLADVWLCSLPALYLRCCSYFPVAISPG